MAYKEDTGRALKKTINSQKMFLTVFGLIVILVMYFRLDGSIIPLIEDGKDAVAERTKLFSTFLEHFTYVLAIFVAGNLIQKSKWFQPYPPENNDHNNSSDS